MRDSLLFFLVYLATPLMLLAGLAVMYLIIGDHPWFAYMAGGYAVMLAVLYLLKISIFRKLYLKRSGGGGGETHG
ncbi:MAG: hypothetical protein M5R41_00880 [Bacteroidia bacterium]|nr:hypothetical protein [Bacteroidia bacterium]